ncbi:MAG: crotonase/enoyl-CoA hydratase family protein [Solirubrobacterales bacterium]|nr:crotonase/enoyl-CoA hydratase family protein [Solirubrobacterales bacterium]
MPAGVQVDRQGPVWTISLDRPERRNAVDGLMAAVLAETFRAFDADQEASVAVLYGAGGNFCAGADLKAAGTPEGNQILDVDDGDGPMGPTRMLLSKPVIAAISGYAVAGGLELAIWCDLRVAADDARFGVFCRRWGVPLIDGGTVRLPRLIGQGRALELILSGRSVEADEALSIGLVNRVVRAGEELTAAQEWAHELAALPQTCLREDRLAALSAWGLPEREALSIELMHGRRSLVDVQDGLERFRAGAGRHGR